MRARRELPELLILLAGIAVLVFALAFLALASEVVAGDTREFDERILRSLRRAEDPSLPVGPAWLRSAALDITALGSLAVLGLTVLAVTGYLLLHGLHRTALFVFLASWGGWTLNTVLKDLFDRTRPDVVSHLREVATSSFPSGHAMTSAAVYLTLGVLLMRLAESRLAKFYCIAVAMLATALVGASRVFLGVHYPSDVLAGWLIGLSWALVCWMIERAIERRAGLKREQRELRRDTGS